MSAEKVLNEATTNCEGELRIMSGEDNENWFSGVL